MSAAKRKERSLAQPRIVIAGGGLAGLSLALALKRALSDGVEVVMCDPALKRDPHGDKRSYAIAAAARRMLEARFRLADAEQLDGTTWRYDLISPDTDSIRAIASSASLDSIAAVMRTPFPPGARWVVTMIASSPSSARTMAIASAIEFAVKDLSLMS